MTLFKQIALMLSIFLLIILGTVFTLNFKSANTSVQERLYEDAKNTATSLSLSLGTAAGDISVMSTMINANFDSGNYLYISLVDVDNVILYERKSENQRITVPEWFLKVVKIHAPVASANVSAGWNQVGILNVQSDVGYAYKQLYTILMSLLLSFSIIAIIALTILNLILVAILKPLKEVQRQAEAVGRNEFIIQKSIPNTKEFKDVVLGMNNMVSKVKAMF
ncbi:MAG: LapD/MoxY N-terminal periplasmic domain-containing protein, partial [Sulfurimonas sp.]|nr:LapD/MoxY N-terminal periplasmic domain-containing protein [Sulfurimonas sp.]